MIHGKAVLIDDVAAAIGSANFDSRSMFLNFEVTSVIHSAPEVREVEAWIKTLMAQTRTMGDKVSRGRDTIEGVTLGHANALTRQFGHRTLSFCFGSASTQSALWSEAGAQSRPIDFCVGPQPVIFAVVPQALAPCHSGTLSPEPPNSLGKSFSLGSPSRIGKTVSA